MEGCLFDTPSGAMVNSQRRRVSAAAGAPDSSERNTEHDAQEDSGR
jgi:hypothetical protein